MSKVMNLTDIEGQRFAKLKVVNYIGTRNRRHYYHCVCDCGREKDVERYALLRGNTKSCGCGKKDDRKDFTDIVGYRFGMLLVKAYVGRESGKAKYRCICDCGNEVITDRYVLLNGESKSCGCMRLIDPLDIVGQKFGSLSVVSYIGKSPAPGYEHMYRCLCDCGKESVVRRDHLLKGETKSCGECFLIEPENDYYRYYCGNGESFIFDACDLPIAESIRFSLSGDSYPESHADGGRFSVIVMKPTYGQLVDHIDGDKRNNRRSNLRLVDTYQNAWNAAIRSTNTSGYKGVYFSRSNDAFVAGIKCQGIYHYLGSFQNPEDAARAYDEAARFYFGEFACVNFPLPGEQCCRRNQEESA